jgi:hypothetical protein
MKTNILNTLLLSTCLIGTAAYADDDCSDPAADWQPKEKLQQLMESKGWEVKRIKVDDGCYEVKGLDRHGHKAEAKFAPASLKMRELEIKFKEGEDSNAYLDK